MHEISVSDHFIVYCIRKLNGTIEKCHEIIKTQKITRFNELAFLSDVASHEVNFQKMGGGEGTQARWMWKPHLNVKKVLIESTREGRSSGASITNSFINTPFYFGYIVW